MMPACMISVVVPLYYGNRYVKKIIAQIEKAKDCLDCEMELIFVNDSPEVPIENDCHSDDLNILCCEMKEHKGIHGARAEGVKRCRGEYVLFLDQDDEISDRYFVSQLKKMTGADAVLCRSTENGRLYYPELLDLSNQITFDRMLNHGNSICSPGQVLLRYDAIPHVWLENVVHNNGADDWMLWLAFLKEGHKFHFNDEILFEHKLHRDNTSFNDEEMSKSESEINCILYKEEIINDIENEKLMQLIKNHDLHRIHIGKNYEKKFRLIHLLMKLSCDDSMDKKFRKKFLWKKVSIYGAGEMGEALYVYLKKIGVLTECFIDANGGNIESAVPVVTLAEFSGNVDGVLVSLVDNAEMVIKQIEAVFTGEVINVQNFISELI